MLPDVGITHRCFLFFGIYFKTTVLFYHDIPAFASRNFQWCNKLTLPAKASHFGRGVTVGDGEGKDADKITLALRYDIPLEKASYRNVQYPFCRACPLRRLRASSPKGRALDNEIQFIVYKEPLVLTHEQRLLSLPYKAAHSPLLCSALMRKQSKAEAKLLIKRRERLPFDQVIALGIFAQIS